MKYCCALAALMLPIAASTARPAAAQSVSIDQTGNANIADSIQDSPDQRLLAAMNGDPSGANIAIISQSGVANTASIEQVAASGAANELTLIQDGNDNIAALSQQGAGNHLDVRQSGDINDAAITQSGYDLGLVINQSGGAAIAVTQTGF
ncbi:hypothetical protein ACFO8O_14580 [Hephaestia sp. GCM10023244]|uniref:hypothetical protein n=1 Tax=unclassified Hephaestia TaxID=2631281 RepID=UPI002077915B|nr:hypothetical protein [Hephaestia sp. MAHUQ-44]MCM8732187.1 hypothetical protein [Hephaestia sp. MAHUQ-44]